MLETERQGGACLVFGMHSVSLKGEEVRDGVDSTKREGREGRDREGWVYGVQCA